MKTVITQFRFLWLLSMIAAMPMSAMGADSPVPPILDRGFQLLKSAGAVEAFDAWRQGGLLAETNKQTSDESIRFKELVTALRNYKSYEVIQVKAIGQTSKILYVTMRFERGVLYGSFLVWKAERDWMVQSMEFNTKPHEVMPWLVLSSGE